MADSNISKNREGYGYKYSDLSQIHNYLEEKGYRYYQFTDTDTNGTDYIYTVPIIDGKELPARRGCRVVNATLSGKSNPAQEHGSALTYARRYSLLMAFGLATEDDDAQCLTREEKKPVSSNKKETESKLNDKQLKVLADEMERTGISEKVLLYNMGQKNSMSELTQKDYAVAIKLFSDTQDKKKEDK